MKHLAIFVSDYIDKILRNQKTIESRFSLNKVAPYLVVSKGDEILLKQSGGMIVGKVEVDNVLYYDNLTGEKIGKLRKEYNSEICANDTYWQEKSSAKYATLIFLVKSQRFLTPLKDSKKDRRSWVVLKN